MFKRIYINNYRCLENFELKLEDKRSALLIGKNGSGKSAVRDALGLLQAVAKGQQSVANLISGTDFFLSANKAPIRLEVDVVLDGTEFHYGLAVEVKPNARVGVRSEMLRIGNRVVFSRSFEETSESDSARTQVSDFRVHWSIVGLPIHMDTTETETLARFKRWLARSIIIAPVPSAISGVKTLTTHVPNRTVSNYGGWFAGLIGRNPAAYSVFFEYLRGGVLPDFTGAKFPDFATGPRGPQMYVGFQAGDAGTEFPFSNLSDGEKCFFICATVLAANKSYGPLFCFWDEPDSHLSMDEVGHFTTALRKSFENVGGQLIVTSHNAEAIRRFSGENTYLLARASHLEPTRVRLLEDVKYTGDVVDAMRRGGFAA